LSLSTWDSKNLHVFLEALKAVLHEIYVVPNEKKTRADAVRNLREGLATANAAAPPKDPAAPDEPKG
jgi:hypothetical protein